MRGPKWAMAGSMLITMYYVAILGWALGMLFGTVGSLFEPGVSAPFTPFAEPTREPSAIVYFFSMIASWKSVLYVAIIWAATAWILRHGAESIERSVRWCVPLMWLFMLVLAGRGLLLDGGVDGVMYLFTPSPAGIAQASVWKGAFSQMFFSLSLGMGIMTAYASYLPRNADQVNNAMLVSFLNCGFEFVAGVAIFALLFVYALNPAGSTLSLSFFVIPQGIGQLSTLPWMVRLFGAIFFALMVMAGLTSAVSLAEAFVSALIDKLGITRLRALAIVSISGALGSLCFSLPMIIDPELGGDGTLGLTLLDVMDHWVFNYSLLLVGLAESILIGWVLGASRLRQAINEHSHIKLGAWFDYAVRYVIPLLLLSVITLNLIQEVQLDDSQGGVPYGSAHDVPGFGWIPWVLPIFWLVGSVAFAWYLSRLETTEKASHATS